MTEVLNKQKKKEKKKDFIHKLHQGLTMEEAKERFEKEVGTTSATEIAEIEQSLINEGISPEEIKKFCNERLERYKVPVRIKIVAASTVSERFKKIRNKNKPIE